MKRNKLKISIIVCMIICMLFSMVGCNREQTSEQPKDPSANEQEKEPQKEEKPEREKTAYNIVEEGSSVYKIVIPKAPSANLTSASEELQNFLFEATGVKLEIISEENATGTDNFISLGKTSVATAMAVEATEEDDLKDSGYRIKTVGSSLAIVANPYGSDEGVIYGVYDFLQEAVGFKVYASDEIVYNKMTTVPLYVYDEVVK